MPFLEGRDYVVPNDVQSIAHETLRHRMILSFEAISEQVDATTIIDGLLQKIEAP